MRKREARRNRSRFLRVAGIATQCGLALFVTALAMAHPALKTGGAAPAGGTAASRMSPKAPSVCITDSRTGDNIQFSSPGGAYTFTQCSTGFTLTGTGTVASQSGVVRLTDHKADRSVNAGLLTGQNTGRVVIYFISTPHGSSQVFTVNQTNPSQACGCSLG